MNLHTLHNQTMSTLNYPRLIPVSR